MNILEFLLAIVLLVLVGLPKEDISCFLWVNHNPALAGNGCYNTVESFI